MTVEQLARIDAREDPEFVDDELWLARRHVEWLAGICFICGHDTLADECVNDRCSACPSGR